MERAIYFMRNLIVAALCCIAAVALMAAMCSKACCADLPPNDKGLCQTIIVCPDSDPLAHAFQFDTKLSQLSNATAFTHFKPGDPLYIERYQAILGTDFPVVVYADCAGRVIYSANRLTMPPTSQLFEAIKVEHVKRKTASLSSVPVSAAYQEPQAEYDPNCPDGKCPVRNPLDQSPNRQPLFPNLQPPLRHPFDMVDVTTNPIDRIFNGAISNTVKSGLFMVFSFVALGIVFVFGMFLLGGMVLLARWMR